MSSQPRRSVSPSSEEDESTQIESRINPFPEHPFFDTYYNQLLNIKVNPSLYFDDDNYVNWYQQQCIEKTFPPLKNKGGR